MCILKSIGDTLQLWSKHLHCFVILFLRRPIIIDIPLYSRKAKHFSLLSSITNSVNWIWTKIVHSFKYRYIMGMYVFEVTFKSEERVKKNCYNYIQIRLYFNFICIIYKLLILNNIFSIIIGRNIIKLHNWKLTHIIQF